MSGNFSVNLYLEGSGKNWSWTVVNNRRDVNIDLPEKVSPADLHKKVIDNRDLVDLIQIQNIGIGLFNSIFPPEIADMLKNAANTGGGDIYCIVPSEWANVPFELCYLLQKGFLGDIFRIGTFIRGKVKGEKEHPPKKIFIITDGTEQTRQEAEEIKGKAKENNWDTHVIFQGSGSTSEKIIQEMQRASIVHYAGHCPEHFLGWQSGSGQVFSISDMEKLGKSYFVPRLIFSNSCYAGNYGHDCGLSGIADIFLEAGVLQVIGPFREVNDGQAKEFALSFYEHLFKGSTPSKAMLAAKKEMRGKNKNAVTRLFYRLYGNPHSPSRKPKIVLWIISSIILCLLIWIIIPSRTVITLGVVDYSIDPGDTILQEELDKICNTAQKKLPFLDRYFKYKFEGRIVISRPYPTIFRELREDIVDIAFVPAYCYLYHRYLDPNKLEGLESVGVKTKWSNLTYTSGFIVRKDSYIYALDDINEKTAKTFIHGDHFSTSTCIIPSIFLLERGLTKIVDGHDVHEPKRHEMIRKIMDSKGEEEVIGTLSNEDWERIRDAPLERDLRIDERDRYADFLRYIPIDNIPIPYDAVLVCKSSWTGRFDVEERKIILNALSNSVGQVRGSWEEQYPTFVDYIASGIIVSRFSGKNQQTDCDCNEGKCCYLVSFLPSGHDLYHITDSVTDKNPVEVDIYRFSGEQGPKYRLEEIKIGSGKLMKLDNLPHPSDLLLFSLNTNLYKDNLVGLHVLARKLAPN
jgi:hypothetical protein